MSAFALRALSALSFAFACFYMYYLYLIFSQFDAGKLNHVFFWLAGVAIYAASCAASMLNVNDKMIVTLQAVSISTVVKHSIS